MSLELRQQIKLAQKLVMTPQLRQAIKLLQLNRLELSEALLAELEENPTLEEAQNENDQSSVAESLNNGENSELGEAIVTRQIIADNPANLGEVNWADYQNNFDSDFSFARETPPADAPSQFEFIAKQPGLEAYMRWQISHLVLEDHEYEITNFILGNLDSHGYLTVDIKDICSYCNTEPEKARRVLNIIQNLDPPGIAARDIKESLLLQLEREGLGDSLAYRIISEHINLLAVRNYKKIAKETGATVHKVMTAVARITALNPYPGNKFTNEQTNYVIPDVYVYKIDNEFVIQLNEDGLPRLQVSKDYRTILKQKKLLNSESRGYLRDKMRNAEWFIKSIQQRQRTIYKVMESILKFQLDFFKHGPGHLKPLILRDVADDIGMHESTISRVTANKYAHTPQGIYELKYFFSTAVSTTDGDVVAAESIKNKIRRLIKHEDSAKPLSDNKIAQLLIDDNIQIARRTVAKYRDQMKILPVKHRRKPVKG